MTRYMRLFEKFSFTKLLVARIGIPRMPVIDGIITRYMKYWDYISLSQLLVGHIGHLEIICITWNYDQIYEILGGHLIDQNTCWVPRTSRDFL